MCIYLPFSASELITFSFVSFICYAFSFLIILNHFLVNNKQFTGEARKTNGLSAALTIVATLTTVLFAYITHITHGFTLFGVLWDLLKYFWGGQNGGFLFLPLRCFDFLFWNMLSLFEIFRFLKMFGDVFHYCYFCLHVKSHSEIFFSCHESPLIWKPSDAGNWTI